MCFEREIDSDLDQWLKQYFYLYGNPEMSV